MRIWTLTAVSILALGAVGCQGLQRPERATTRLDCPARFGSLQRLSVAADGRACLYRSDEGAEVALRLAPVVGGLKATLSAFEAEALRMRGPEPAAAAAGTTPGADTAARDAAAAVAQAEADAGIAEAKGDSGPDAAIIVDEAGADIDVPGLRVKADDEGAHIRIGGIEIDAGDDGATVREAKDVRLRGEATSREKRGVRAMFLKVAGEHDPRPSVGYQLAGPKAGPVTVAFSKWTSGDYEDLFSDVRKLVRRNGGA